MNYFSQNPYTRQILQEFECCDQLDLSFYRTQFRSWKSTTMQHRIECVKELISLLNNRVETYANLITEEMGKPITEANAEIRKCINATEYLISQADNWIRPRELDCEALYAVSIPEPLGPILAIMPWNFPFWQVLRAAIPNLLVGNTVLLKHAPNVPRCAAALNQLFKDAGFPNGVFSNHYLSHEGVARLIATPTIAAVTFTGSDAAGSIVAAIAGQSIKKITLELGGNDPMIVFDDCSLENAITAAEESRSINSGQACNGAKRFIVQQGIHDQFIEQLTQRVQVLKCGDPSDVSTQIGPLARRDLYDKLSGQVHQSLEMGAVCVLQQPVKEENSWIFPPTVLSDVQPGQPAFEEELFGPVWSVTSFACDDEAIALANESHFGLGASVWTTHEERIARMMLELETGNVFVNDFVRSDPRFPFGGVKRSGHGKELGEVGFFEFVNWKTIYRKL